MLQIYIIQEAVPGIAEKGDDIVNSMKCRKR
jgi:hypothetical protein